MMNKSRRRAALKSASCALLLLAVPAVFASEAETYTYSNFQMSGKALTLELEIHPHLLQQARVLRDRDGDGQMSQLEFEESRDAIEQYFQQKIAITINERVLRADSAAIVYRFADSAAVSSRIYVTCWFALLLKPQQLVLNNEMFQELSERSRSYGALADGKRVADFEFRAVSAKASAPIEIEFSSSGDWHLQQPDAAGLSPAAFWSLAGGSGLLLIAAAAYVRKILKRRSRHRHRRRRSRSIAAAREHLQDVQVLC